MHETKTDFMIRFKKGNSRLPSGMYHQLFSPKEYLIITRKRNQHWNNRRTRLNGNTNEPLVFHPNVVVVCD